MEGANEPDSTVSCDSSKKCCACDYVPKCMVDLVMWRDVKKTAPVVLGGLALLTMLVNLSLISVFAYCGLFLLVCAGITKALFKFAPKMVENCPFTTCVCPTDESKKTCEVTREQAERVVDKLLPRVNAMLLGSREVFLVANPIETAKFALIFWILTYVGACFNLITLIITAFVLAFTVPRVYEQFQPQFDNVGALIKAHLGQVCKLVHEKVNEAKQKVRERTAKKAQ